MNKSLSLILYTLSLAVILWFPVSKIIKFETSQDFMEIKFKATVHDPYDPMRGRYVQLSVLPNKWMAPKEMSWNGQDGYAVIKKDPTGFAQIIRLEKNFPQLQNGECAVKVNQVYSQWDHEKQKETGEYTFSLPFDRFYLNELKAPELEQELQNFGTVMTLKVKIFRDGSFAVTGLEKP